MSTAITMTMPRAPGRDMPDSCGDDHAAIDAVQLARLAHTVLQKSPDDLTALASTNPHVAREWIEAFAKRKHEAEAAARFWSAAMASLSTVAPVRLSMAAE